MWMNLNDLRSMTLLPFSISRDELGHKLSYCIHITYFLFNSKIDIYKPIKSLLYKSPRAFPCFLSFSTLLVFQYTLSGQSPHSTGIRQEEQPSQRGWENVGHIEGPLRGNEFSCESYTSWVHAHKLNTYAHINTNIWLHALMYVQTVKIWNSCWHSCVFFGLVESYILILHTHVIFFITIYFF